jgi:DGQHR domain-containing protein
MCILWLAKLHCWNAECGGRGIRVAPQLVIQGMVGSSAGRKVLLGFAPARTLCRLSFADVLDEDTSRGYQRRLNSQHSLDFRRYIQREGSSTIPLTFNLRPDMATVWRVLEVGDGRARLEIADETAKVLAQVDCQHRLGHLSDLDLALPFMCFIGLDVREETEVFNVINSKARGLSKSLLDFHDAQLSNDLAGDRPELYIALYLRNEPSSPWHRQLDLGGASTSGLSRRASLRTAQKAIKVFLGRTKILRSQTTDVAAQVVLDFWCAVASVLAHAWSHPRAHMLTKGIGVYALMEVAADIYLEAAPHGVPDRRRLTAAVADFAGEFDWSTQGPLKGLGGQGGVKAAVGLVRDARKKARFRVVSNG